jgi:hypothetical protein
MRSGRFDVRVESDRHARTRRFHVRGQQEFGGVRGGAVGRRCESGHRGAGELACSREREGGGGGERGGGRASGGEGRKGGVTDDPLPRANERTNNERTNDGENTPSPEIFHLIDFTHHRFISKSRNPYSTVTTADARERVSGIGEQPRNYTDTEQDRSPRGRS